MGYIDTIIESYNQLNKGHPKLNANSEQVTIMIHDIPDLLELDESAWTVESKIWTKPDGKKSIYLVAKHDSKGITLFGEFPEK